MLKTLDHLISVQSFYDLSYCLKFLFIIIMVMNYDILRRYFDLFIRKLVIHFQAVNM